MRTKLQWTSMILFMLVSAFLIPFVFRQSFVGDNHIGFIRFEPELDFSFGHGGGRGHRHQPALEAR